MEIHYAETERHWGPGTSHKRRIWSCRCCREVTHTCTCTDRKPNSTDQYHHKKSTPEKVNDTPKHNLSLPLEKNPYQNSWGTSEIQVFKRLSWTLDTVFCFAFYIDFTFIKLMRIKSEISVFEHLLWSGHYSYHLTDCVTSSQQTTRNSKSRLAADLTTSYCVILDWKHTFSLHEMFSILDSRKILKLVALFMR